MSAVPMGPGWGRRCAVIAVTLAMGLAVGCGGSDDAATKSSNEPSAVKGGNEVTTADKFTIAVPYDINVLDPMSGENIADLMLYGNINETLVVPEFPDNKVAPPEIGPGLATKWTQKDDTTWEFKLREGVKFTNGEPFDAEAVKFTIDRFLDPATQAAHASFLHVKEVKIVDPMTVDLVTDGPSPDLLRALFAVLMEPPKAVKAGVEAYNQKPIGTGPYMISDTTPDEVTFVVNPDYWNKDKIVPFGKTISLVSRPEAATRVAAIQAGEVDVAEDIPLESVDQLPSVKSVPSNENIQIIMNASEDGAFKNDKLREAAIIGVNREEIRKGLYGDKYSRSPNCQQAAPAVFGFNPDIKAPPYDPEKAKQLVKDSGYNGEEIRLVGAAGRYSKGDEMLAAVAQQWKDIGMKVNLRILPADAWVTSLFGEEQGGKTVHKGHDAIIVGLSAFSLSAIEPLATGVDTGAQLDTFPHKSFPEVQTLLDKAKVELDPEKQRVLLEEVAAGVCKANSHLFITNNDQIWGVKDDSSPFSPRPDLRDLLFAQK